MRAQRSPPAAAAPMTTSSLLGGAGCASRERGRHKRNLRSTNAPQRVNVSLAGTRRAHAHCHQEYCGSYGAARP